MKSFLFLILMSTSTARAYSSQPRYRVVLLNFSVIPVIFFPSTQFNMSLINRLLIEYDHLSTVDKENTAGWNSLFTSTLFTPIFTAFYVIFALRLGPKMMKNRRPFSLRYLVIGYNIFQMACNAILFVEWAKYLWWNRHSFRCLGIEKPGSRNFDWVVDHAWITVANRMIDMLDTVFHVLRKKYSHISFLHIYHHATSVVLGWWMARYYPGGGAVVFVVWNSFVHFFMYSYYFASAQSSLKPYAARFKKRITQLQLIQFITLLPYAIYVMTDSNCYSYPRWLMWLALSEDFIFIYLFGRFYVRAYFKNKKED